MVRRVKFITYVLSFARTEYYRFIVIVVEPAVGGWCAHSVCHVCVLIAFVADTQVAICVPVFQYSLDVGNKFVRLDFSVDTEIRNFNRIALLAPSSRVTRVHKLKHQAPRSRLLKLRATEAHPP